MNEVVGLGPILILGIFFFGGSATLLGLAWWLGGVNKHEIVVTIDHEEDRVAEGNTVNVYTAKTDAGQTIDLQNTFSLYSWKWLGRVKSINQLLVEGGKYRLVVAGLNIFYGQNILYAKREAEET